ncbi:hypothetical protein [Gemmatimonas aurantiaca]|uniref:hypothetical protein n=1 Tax=Gemmatimonas aurantiaca TaxID=173480 RepID=UPI00301DB002
MRILGWLFLTTLSLVLMAQLAVLGAPLKLPEAPAGIVSFELAFSAARATHIVDAWRGQNLLETARVHLGIDVAFLLVYPWCFFTGIRLLQTVEQRHGPSRFCDLGHVLAWLVLLCTPLDGLENLLLWQTITSGATPARALLAGTAATFKFLLVVAALLWCLTAVGRWWLRRHQRSLLSPP